MDALTPVAVSAATLTAQEIATCFLRGIPFTDLAILIVPPSETFGRSMTNVVNAINQGAAFVWQIDPVCQAISLFTSWTHLKVFQTDDELVMSELPLFRCRVREFLQLLGITPDAT